LRDETFARQKQLGVIPVDAELTARHAGSPRAERPLYSSTATRSHEDESTPPVPMIFSGAKACDLGDDTGSPVADDNDHLITPEQRLRVVMTRQ
jgi:hypothetical protein